MNKLFVKMGFGGDRSTPSKHSKKLKLLARSPAQLPFQSGILWVIGLIAIGVILVNQVAIQTVVQKIEMTPKPTQNLLLELGSLPKTPQALTVQDTSEPFRSPEFVPEPDQQLSYVRKLGHFPYSEGSPAWLMIISSYGLGSEQRFERLYPEVSLALMKMIYAARMDGVWILPVSGFRDIQRQDELFQQQIQQTGSAESAAKSVAPPGYSEHHTGYAVDLADGSSNGMDVGSKFENTQALRWLNQHAYEFGFEMSFPLDNAQGVKYEPWHWRFVNSPSALKIFAEARSYFQHDVRIGQ